MDTRMSDDELKRDLAVLREYVVNSRFRDGGRAVAAVDEAIRRLSPAKAPDSHHQFLDDLDTAALSLRGTPGMANEANAVRWAISRLINEPVPAPVPEGSKETVIAIVWSKLSDGEDYGESEVVYGNPELAMRRLRSSCGRDKVTHECIARVIVPPVAAVPVVRGEVITP